MKGIRLIASLLILSALSVSTFLIFGKQPTSALSGSQFKADRIIDDSLFYRGNDMTPNEIQNFLNSKVPVCDTNHAKSSSSNDSGPPYTCLKDYRQNTPPRTDDLGLCSYLDSRNNRTAAAIIYDVSRACGISAKVILVTLQKEQSLVTDTWPWDIQYRKAMGYGCPDSAPCDSKYFGFFNQVYNAARQFKRYKAFPSNYNYRKGFTSFIQWHPNGGCGGSNVKIQNHATAGLYNYTPYRPNQAALNNLYGTGNSCSSYGNRNFWRFYNDWFGSTFVNTRPDIPMVGDWDGDGGDEIGLRRIDEYFLNFDHSAPSEEEFIYGLSTDKLILGSWQTDTETEIAVKRENVYYLNFDSDSIVDRSFSFGKDSDKPFSGDWDGDTRDEIALRRGKTYFFDYNNTGGAEAAFSFGRHDDMVIYGDWDGDGDDEIGLKRGKQYFFSSTLSSGADTSFTFGRPDDQVIIGDWDGDGDDEIGLKRGKTYFFTHTLSPGAETSFTFGRPDDQVIIGDWDGDGDDEIGLKRGKTYYLSYDLSPVADESFSFGR